MRQVLSWLLRALVGLLVWLVSELKPAQNAPRWAALAVAALTAWLAGAGIEVSGEVQAALVVLVAGLIGTVVQKLATLPR